MKKYIFTFNYVINYGAFLQCFSLSSLDNEMFVVDLLPSSFRRLRYFVGPYGRKKMPVVWIFVAMYRFFRSVIYSRIYRFEENKKINLTKRYETLKPQDVAREFDGNIALVGSDQVWNPKFIEGREKIFFAQEANFSKRVAYAASLGMSKWPAEFQQKVYKYVKQFDHISVREKSGAEYLSSIGFPNVKWVCDPTILHDGDFYRAHFPNQININSFVFAYTIREKIPDDLFKFDVKNKISICAGKYKNIVSVSDWLAYIDKSEYVITDSFHCVVFCLLFHKRFIVLLNNSRGVGMNERFASLLGRVNLEYRCISSRESIEKCREIVFRSVDWKKIDDELGEWRQDSLAWLKNAISN